MMVAEATGMDPESLDERFIATILPTFRSYKAIVGYTCLPGTTVSCPIYAFGGSADRIVDYESVLAWADFTTSQFSSRVFPGDHFYVSQNAAISPKRSRQRSPAAAAEVSESAEPFSLFSGRADRPPLLLRIANPRCQPHIGLARTDSFPSTPRCGGALTTVQHCPWSLIGVGPVAADGATGDRRAVLPASCQPPHNYFMVRQRHDQLLRTCTDQGVPTSLCHQSTSLICTNSGRCHQ